MEALSENEDGTIVPQMEARRLIDQMRVALSRSTSRIVFVEPADVPVFERLAFDAASEAISLGWTELAEFLQADTMTELELVSGLLDEAEELADRSRLEDALRRNRRAAAIAERAGSPDAQAQARRQQATLLLRHAEELLDANALAQAQESFQLLTTVADTLPDDYLPRMNELQDRLTAASDTLFDKLLAQSADALDALEYADAHAATQRALAIAGRAATQNRIARARVAAIAATSAWAADLAAAGDDAFSIQLSELLEDLAELQSAAGDVAQSAQSALLARRYYDQTQRSGLHPMLLRNVLAFANAVLALQSVDDAALTHVRLWIEETFADLGDNVDLYELWAQTAARFAKCTAYPPLDEHLWDLENRLTVAETAGAPAPLDRARFVAFLADYGGDHAHASLLWEELGAMDQAIQSARNAGDLERAYTLLRKTNPSHVPEAVSTAVKTLRLLQQLTQKQHHLYPAERSALFEELQRLLAALEKDGE